MSAGNMTFDQALFQRAGYQQAYAQARVALRAAHARKAELESELATLRAADHEGPRPEVKLDESPDVPVGPSCDCSDYYEPYARWLESRANRASGRGDHGEANRLWSLAAQVGTRVEYDENGDEIERPDLLCECDRNIEVSEMHRPYCPAAGC